MGRWISPRYSPAGEWEWVKPNAVGAIVPQFTATALAPAPTLNNGAVEPAVFGAVVGMPAPTVTAETLITVGQITAGMQANAPGLLLQETAQKPGVSAVMPAPAVIAGQFINPFGSSMGLTCGTPTIIVSAPSVVTPSAASMTLTGGVPTIVNRNLVLPVFDAIGAGYQAAASGTDTFSHTGAAGADVFLLFAVKGTPTIGAVTYGGVAMNQIALVPMPDGSVAAAYRLAGITSGAKTVSITLSGTISRLSANTISYKNVSAVAVTSVTGASTTASQAVTYPAGALLLEGLYGVATGGGGGGWSSISGGTARYNDSNSAVGNASVLAIREASATTTFSASLLNVTNWAALSLVLSGT